MKAGLKKVALATATLFLLAVFVAPSTSASSLTAAGDSSYIPVSSISGYTTSQSNFEDESSAEEPMHDVSAETEKETQTEAPQVNEEPVYPDAEQQLKGQGKSNEHGKGLLKKM